MTMHAGSIAMLRRLAPPAIVVVNVAAAALIILRLMRQYGVSTANSDGLLPTPWETGRAPYILALLTTVLASAILTGAGYRGGRYALMIVTTIYTICLLIFAAEVLLSMRAAQIHWTVYIAASDSAFVALVIGWWFTSYWSLFKASPYNNLR
jgi:hypothetical protein